MSPDLKAVPLLTLPATIAGEGCSHGTQDGATLLDSLRTRFVDLSPRELCRLLRETYYADLASLVISTPYSASLLKGLREGLAEPVWEALAQDCQGAGDTLLSADQACGAYRRLEASLTQLVARRATPEQQEQLGALAQQLMALDDADFRRCIEALGSMHLQALLKQSGGIEASFAVRVRAVVGAKGWEFLAGDYQDEAAEPILREDAEPAIAGLNALMQGQPWPVADAFTAPDWTQIEALTGLDLEK